MKIIQISVLYIFILLLTTLNTWSQTGKIEGRIYDKTNKEALAFANIIITGTTIGTTSDFDGNFSFTGLKPGFVQLEATYVGYNKALSSEIQVTNAKIVYIAIEMESTGNQLEEIVVAASPYRKTDESPVSLQRIGLADIENNPGSNRDIAKVIQSFP